MEQITDRDLWSKQDKNDIVLKIKEFLYRSGYPDASLKDLKNLAENLFHLNSDDLTYLAKIHFLLSLAESGFVEKVEKILRKLSHSTQQEIISSHQGIRGRIDWGLTIKQRCAQGFNPSLFVCRPTQKISY